MQLRGELDGCRLATFLLDFRDEVLQRSIRITVCVGSRRNTSFVITKKKQPSMLREDCCKDWGGSGSSVHSSDIFLINGQPASEREPAGLARTPAENPAVSAVAGAGS